MGDQFDILWEIIKDKKNVVGYSKSWKERIKDGKAIGGSRVFRVYVARKEPLETLDEKDRIPQKIHGIDIDIVEIGELKALPEKKRSS